MSRAKAVRLTMVLLCLFAAGFFGVQSFKAGEKADSLWQNVTICMAEELSVEDVGNLWDKVSDAAAEDDGKAFSFTAWKEQTDQTVTDPDLGRSVQTHVVSLYGSSESVLPVAPVLDADEAAGCLVAKDTAWQLFGSTDVVGQTICVDANVYTIRGIVMIPATGVYVQIRGNESVHKQMKFNRLTLGVADTESGNQFLSEYALTGRVIRSDNLLDVTRYTELIPGKWSDFDGWKQNWKRLQQEIRQNRMMRKTTIEDTCEKWYHTRIQDLLLEVLCVLLGVIGFFRLFDGGGRKLLPAFRSNGRMRHSRKQRKCRDARDHTCENNGI